MRGSPLREIGHQFALYLVIVAVGELVLWVVPGTPPRWAQVVLFVVVVVVVSIVSYRLRARRRTPSSDVPRTSHP